MKRGLCSECGRANGQHEDDCPLPIGADSFKDARMLADLALRIAMKKVVECEGDPVRIAKALKDDD